jgi:predicted 2-oxoglutarate/Fe(II)-dependent dioxygenase YbiX
MTKYVQPYSILRTRTGEGFPYHSDAITDIHNVFGLVFYLNDDYTGGELHYQDLNISIKPKANSMLIHRAHLIHGVTEVTSGTRYAVSSFIEGDKTTAIREN